MRTQHMPKIAKLLSKALNGIALTESEERLLRGFRNDTDRALRERFPNGPDASAPPGSHTF